MNMRKKSVSIKVDATVYNQAAEVLKSRGTDIETWFKLQLRAFSRSGKSLLCLKDKIPFGKYAGELVEDVVRADTAYAIWMVAQNYTTKFDTDVHQLVQELGE